MKAYFVDFLSSKICYRLQSYILNLQVCMSVCLCVWAVSRHCPDLCFFFFFYGFYFFCLFNCPDLFFFFFCWVLFSVSIKLPGPLFFFCFFVFLFFFDGFCFLWQLLLDGGGGLEKEQESKKFLRFLFSNKKIVCSTQTILCNKKRLCLQLQKNLFAAIRNFVYNNKRLSLQQ